MQIAEKLETELNNENLTFKPQLNKGVKSKFEGTSFLQRQKIFQKRKNENQEKLEKSENLKMSFKPKLNKKSLKLAEKRQKADKENIANFKLEFKRTNEFGDVQFSNSDSYNADRLISEIKHTERARKKGRYRWEDDFSQETNEVVTVHVPHYRSRSRDDRSEDSVA